MIKFKQTKTVGGIKKELEFELDNMADLFAVMRGLDGVNSQCEPEPEKPKGLRMDYFLSLGFKLVIGDEYAIVGNHAQFVVSECDAYTQDSNREERLITSFASRCGIDPESIYQQNVSNPVIVSYDNELAPHIRRYCGGLNWLAVANWKPDIDKLIEMQAINDKEVS